jgi:hypothetical protein
MKPTTPHQRFASMPNTRTEEVINAIERMRDESCETVNRGMRTRGQLRIERLRIAAADEAVRILWLAVAENRKPQKRSRRCPSK